MHYMYHIHSALLPAGLAPTKLCIRFRRQHKQQTFHHVLHRIIHQRVKCERVEPGLFVAVLERAAAAAAGVERGGWAWLSSAVVPDSYMISSGTTGATLILSRETKPYT